MVLRLGSDSGRLNLFFIAIAVVVLFIPEGSMSVSSFLLRWHKPMCAGSRTKCKRQNEKKSVGHRGVKENTVHACSGYVAEIKIFQLAKIKVIVG